MTDGDLVVPVNMEDFTPVQTGIIQVRTSLFVLI
jgi:hypothetical protein